MKFKSDSLETLVVHVILPKYVHWLPASFPFYLKGLIGHDNNEYIVLSGEECPFKSSDDVAMNVEFGKEKRIRTKEMNEIWDFMTNLRWPGGLKCHLRIKTHQM